MDSSAIISSVGEVATICKRVISLISTIIDGTRNANKMLGELLQDVTSLLGTCEAFVQAPKQNETTVFPEFQIDDDFAEALQNSIKDCRLTLEPLENMLDDVQKPRPLTRGFIGVLPTQLRLKSKADEFPPFNKLLSWHKTSLQCSLQFFQVFKIMQTNLRQERGKKSLAMLKVRIGEAEATILDHKSQIVTDIREEKSISSLGRLAKIADAFYTKTNAILEGGEKSTSSSGNGREQSAKLRVNDPNVPADESSEKQNICNTVKATLPTSDSTEQSTTCENALQAATNCHPNIIIGIHFDMESTSVAFTSANSAGNLGKPRVVGWWARDGRRVQSVPTTLYYGGHGNLLGWGYDLAEVFKPSGARKCYFNRLEWLKQHFSFHPDDLVSSLPYHGHNGNGGPMSIVDVASEYLSRIRLTTLEYTNKTGLGDVSPMSPLIEYCFTIPGYWDDKIPEDFQEAITRAGFVTNQSETRVTFVTELLANILYCSQSGVVELNTTETVLVVCCGIFGYDLITYQASEAPLGLIEYTEKSGSHPGPISILRNFVTMVREKIRRMRLPDGSRTASRVWTKCMYDFNCRIRNDFCNNGQRWRLEVGIEAEFPDADIEDGWITFSNNEILSCFNPIVMEISMSIMLQIEEAKTKGCSPKTIVLSGELAASEFVFQRIRDTFPKHRVIRPTNSTAAMAEGAVNFAVSSISREEIFSTGPRV